MFLSKSYQKTKKIFPQITAAFAVWLIATQIGVLCVWTSPYLVQLTAPNSPIPLTLDEASWVASLLYAGRFIGAILGSISLSVLGSKNSTLITAIPFSVGWILICFADSPMWLYISRVCSGIGFGLIYNCFSLYLGEIASPDIRGALVSIAVMGTSFGDFFAAIAGANMSLQASSLTFFIPCAIAAILLFLLPNSPHHLIKIKNIDAAKKSIIWYHVSDQVEQELEEITQFVTATDANNFSEKLAEFKLRHNQRATIIVMVLFIFMQACGLNYVILYMEMILIQSQSNVLLPSTVVSYSLVVAVITGIICIGVYDKCGRRIVQIVSCLGVSISHVMLGTHFMLLDYEINWFGSQYLPIISVNLFVIFFTIGLNAMPSIVASEIYSANIKPLAATLGNITAAATAFLVVKAYQPLVDSIGPSYLLFGHAIFILSGIAYAIMFMPETKGKSLQQIQEDLMKK